MKLPNDPLLPNNATPTADWLNQLVFRLTLLFRDVAKQVNGISEGQASAVTNAYTTYPTSGTWAQGDFVKNSLPTEAGSAGNKYVTLGWVCTVSGTPGTWLPCRVLTGN